MLRLDPPAAFGRRALQDVQLGKYLVPKGTDIIVLPRVIHRDTRTWGRTAGAFDPERWLKKPEALGPYLPFSGGPRNCIGMKVALVELKVALACILRKYRVAPADGGPPPYVVIDLTLKPTAFALAVSRRMPV